MYKKLNNIVSDKEMTKNNIKEFKSIRKRYLLSRADFARLVVKKCARNVWCYEAGKVEISNEVMERVRKFDEVMSATGYFPKCK